MGESLKADGKFPLILEPKQLQEHLILQLPFYTGIFLANELRANPLSISCVLKRRFFVINRLSYDACSAEKSKDLICPQESIPFDSIGFYSLFVVAILYQRRWLMFWATIAQAARAARSARDSMVGLISISCFKL